MVSHDRQWFAVTAQLAAVVSSGAWVSVGFTGLVVVLRWCRCSAFGGGGAVTGAEAARVQAPPAGSGALTIATDHPQSRSEYCRSAE